MNSNETHYTFISKTDRKNLHTQIKGLVTRAQQIANNELDLRRKRLRELVDYEDKIYEEEFASKVKSRIDQDIRNRKNELLLIKNESMKSAADFLESKRIQQNINSCYEIREALRQKETFSIKECQLQQIAEKDRLWRRNKDIEKYWLNVQNATHEKEQLMEEKEFCLKKKLNEQRKFLLTAQIHEQNERKEELRQIKKNEARELDKILEQIRLEEFDRKNKHSNGATEQYRNDLLQQIKLNEEKRRQMAFEQAESHRRLMADLRCQEAAEAAAKAESKRSAQCAAVDFIHFARDLREIEKDREAMKDERLQDLQNVDRCTKSTIAREKERKAKEAVTFNSELKRQICDLYDRRVKEESERRECKIVENLFAREENNQQNLEVQRRNYRKELDDQINQSKLIRSKDEERYEKSLLRASDDPEFCAELAKKICKDGIDYLEPHPNWKTLLFPKHKLNGSGDNVGDSNYCQLVNPVYMSKQIDKPNCY